MEPTPAERTTRLLNRLVRGDRDAADEVLPVVYGELHRIAEATMGRQAASHTLQPTAVIHEAWMRIASAPDAELGSRQQFFALAARAMRSVVVDHARAAAARKRDGGRRLTLTFDHEDAAPADGFEVLDFAGALSRLEERDPELARLVELRFFAGLTHGEIGDVMELSRRAVERRWRLARAFLSAELAR